MTNLALAEIEEEDLPGIPEKPELRKAAERLFKAREELKEKKKEQLVQIKPITDRIIDELGIIGAEIRKAKKATISTPIGGRLFHFSLEKKSSDVKITSEKIKKENAN